MVLHSPDGVRLAVSISRGIWANMSPYTIWSWRSCGVARFHGVRSGRGLRRTALIT